MKLPSLISPNNLSKPTTFPQSLNFSSPNHYYQSSKLFLKPRTISCLTPCSVTIRASSIKTQNHLNPEIVETSLSSTAQQDDLQFVQTKNPNVAPFLCSFRRMFSSSDYVFFLFTFIAFTISAAFVSFVAAAVPALYAMGRAAISFAKLADTVREELPSTMAAVRLSGMEFSDLTLELTELSQEISDGVDKSAQAIVAAETGIRQIGARAREQTISIIEERANLPVISLRPAISTAAKKTSRAVGHATRNFINRISGGDSSSEDQNG